MATAHFADHCLGPMIYGEKALVAAGGSAADERAWQLAALPDEMRDLILSAMERRRSGKPTSAERVGHPANGPG